MELEFLSYIYPEYTLAIIVLTEVIKRAFSELDHHPKWTGLGVGIVLGILGAMIKLEVQHESIDFFKMVLSFGVSVIGYDYFWKPVKDRFTKK